jgi:hypothetical protein
MEDSAGETPTDAVGTAALPEEIANPQNSHSDGSAKTVRRVGARGLQTAATGKPNERPPLPLLRRGYGGQASPLLLRRRGRSIILDTSFFNPLQRCACELTHKVARFWMEDSAGETPTDAVGTTALPEEIANPQNSHSDGSAKTVRRVGARGLQTAAAGKPNERPPLPSPLLLRRRGRSIILDTSFFNPLQRCACERTHKVAGFWMEDSAGAPPDSAG